MTITSFVVISSKDRTNDSRSTTDFTYSIGQTIEVSSIAIKTVSIPVVQYNINQTNNKLTLLIENSPPKVIFIEQGQYDISSFMTSLQTSLRETVLDETFSVSQNSLTGKLLITSDVTIFSVDIDPTNSPMAKVIGFDLKINSIPVFSQEIIPPYIPRLGGTKNYYLTSQVLSQGFNGIFRNGQQLPLLINIPITEPYGFVEQYEPQVLNVKTFNRPQNLQWIDIKILDEDMNTVDLLGADIEIVLKIYTKESPWIPKSES